MTVPVLVLQALPVQRRASGRAADQETLRLLEAYLRRVAKLKDSLTRSSQLEEAVAARAAEEAVREELFAREFEMAEPEGLEAMGALSSERRRGVFIEALQGLVFPGLAQVGVDPASATAWLNKRMSPGLKN